MFVRRKGVIGREVGECSVSVLSCSNVVKSKLSELRKSSKLVSLG